MSERTALDKKQLETGAFVLQWVMSVMTDEWIGYSDEDIKWLFSQENIEETLKIVRARKEAG